MDNKESPYEVCFYYDKTSHWEETAIALTADSMLFKPDNQETKE